MNSTAFKRFCSLFNTLDPCKLSDPCQICTICATRPPVILPNSCPSSLVPHLHSSTKSLPRSLHNRMSNTNTPQRTYIQKDGTIIPHSSRPLSARFSDLVASLVLFLTLFWQSLFNVFYPSLTASLFSDVNGSPEGVVEVRRVGRVVDHDSVVQRLAVRALEEADRVIRGGDLERWMILEVVFACNGVY
jgi:hypothetical protein